MNVYPISCGLGYVFLIETNLELFLIDAGSPGHHEQVITIVKQLGMTNVKLIIITHAHYDHYGSASAIKRQTNSSIAVHHLDAESMQKGESPLGTPRNRGVFFPPILWVLDKVNPLPPTFPDILLKDGDSLVEFGLDAMVLHTPGHTNGHCCIVLRNGIVFAGDLLGRVPYLKPQNLLATDWGQIPESIKKLKKVNPTKIYTGHSKKPIQGKKLDYLIDNPNL